MPKMTMIPEKTIETVDCGPFRLNLRRGAMHEAGKSMYGKRSFGPDIPVGWSVELWRNFDSIQKTEFPDEAMARAVFEHLAEGLPVRLARIAHRLDK